MNSTTSRKRKALSLLLATVVALSATGGLVGLAGAATTTDLNVSIADDDDAIATGETTTVEIAVTDVEGGVGAAELGVTSSDPGVATITDVAVLNDPGNTDNNVAGGGTSADVKYAFADSSDTGSVTIVEVTMQAASAGATDIEISENSQTGNLVVFDENGAGYMLDTVDSATLTVNTPPSADAGTDQTVTEGKTVDLDGSGSNDPDQGDTLSYDWTETSDSGVSLSDADTATPTFTAPDVSEATTLDFEVDVTDSAGATDTDSVSVTVEPAEPDPAVFEVSNLQAPSSAIQDDEIDVSADIENTGGQTDTQAVEFRIDTDGDDSIDDEDAVVSQDVGLDPGESTTVTFEDVDTSGLDPGTLTHGVATEDDSETAEITINAPAEANFQVANLQAPGSATQGDAIDVSADIENTGEQTAEKSVEFRVDSNDDGEISDESAIVLQDVELDPGESTTVTFEDVDTGGLAVGTLTHGVATEDDSATAQITIEEPAPPADKETTVSLKPADQTGAVGVTTTYDVVVDNVDGGVGAGEVAVAVDDTSVATIMSVEVSGPNDVEQEITDSSAEFDYFGADTAQTGSVTIAEVTVVGAGAGDASLSIEPTDGNSEVLLFDEEGQPYDVTGTNGAGLEVLPVQFLVDSTSADEKAAVGSTTVVEATVSSDGEVESTQTVELLFDVNGDGDLESVDTQQVTIGANGQTQVSFDVNVPADATFGERDYEVVTVADSAGGTVEFTPPAVNEGQELPGDPDDDGLYEDVNGDDSVDAGDAQSLFSNRDAPAVVNNVAAFDFNGDGKLDVGDAQALFNELTA